MVDERVMSIRIIIPWCSAIQNRRIMISSINDEFKDDEFKRLDLK